MTKVCGVRLTGILALIVTLTGCEVPRAAERHPPQIACDPELGSASLPPSQVRALRSRLRFLAQEARVGDYVEYEEPTPIGKKFLAFRCIKTEEDLTWIELTRMNEIGEVVLMSNGVAKFVAVVDTKLKEFDRVIACFADGSVKTVVLEETVMPLPESAAGYLGSVTREWLEIGGEWVYCERVDLQHLERTECATKRLTTFWFSTQVPFERRVDAQGQFSWSYGRVEWEGQPPIGGGLVLAKFEDEGAPKTLCRLRRWARAKQSAPETDR
ncbi:MAG: hypothetical protein HYY18_14690 [Planctomycetes bacterium]|nr:hypothetical protein [Planctomycetota bacterium]